MIKNTYLGKFIVFEGLDGSGQSTQAGLLKDYLLEEGKEVILTKEPTFDSDAGKKIKEILSEKDAIHPGELQKLFTEDRKEHLENLIVPALEVGKIVISDRYFFSTFAYGVSDGLNLEELIKMNNNFLLPDITIFLKVRPKVCIERIEKRGEQIKLFEKNEKLGRVWQTYEILPNRFENIYTIDGERPIDRISQEIIEIVNNKLK